MSLIDDRPAPQVQLVQRLENELGGAASVPAQALLREAQLMEHLAGLAAESESEADAEAFLGALVPLVSSLVPAVARAAPALVKGVTGVGRALWRDPATRQMVRAVPSMLRRTAADLAGQYGAGRPVTTDTVTRALSRQASQVLRMPDQRRRALQAHAVLRRQQQARARAARLAAQRRSQARQGGPVPATAAAVCPCCGRPQA